MDKVLLFNSFRHFFPDDYTANFAAGKIIEWGVHLKITKPRTSKLGDYSPPVKVSYHRISVNGNLDKYSFFITLLHEMAHLIVWNAYRNKVLPHGKEWKNEFRKLLEQFTGNQTFPPEVEEAILQWISQKNHFPVNPDYLMEILQKNSGGKVITYVKDLPDNSKFILKTGRRFIRLEKIRKRYKCRDCNNGKIYLVHPLTEVVDYSINEE